MKIIHYNKEQTYEFMKEFINISRKLNLFIAATLDGYIATKDESVE